jgi:hypothetical protein
MYKNTEFLYKYASAFFEIFMGLFVRPGAQKFLPAT